MKRPRGDGIDLELLEASVETEGYQRIRARIERMIAASSADLEAADSWEKVLRLQAELKTLRRVIALPVILADEMRKGESK